MPKTKKISKTQKFFNWFKPTSPKKTALLFVILFAVVGGAYFLYSSFAATGIYLYLSPATATVNQGSTFDIKVYENSGTTAVNAVVANVTFPTAYMQYQSVDTTGSNFTINAKKAVSGNTVSVESAGFSKLTGSQLVATIHFKVLTSTKSITAALNFAGGSQLLDANTNSNVLSYTVGSTLTLAIVPKATYIKLSVPSATYSLASGSQVAVQLNENSSTAPINAFQVSLQYKTSGKVGAPSILEFDHATLSSPFFQAMAPSINNNTVTMAGGCTCQLTGVQTIATIYFNVKGIGKVLFKATPDSVLLNAATNQNVPIGSMPSSAFTFTQ